MKGPLTTEHNSRMSLRTLCGESGFRTDSNAVKGNSSVFSFIYIYMGIPTDKQITISSVYIESFSCVCVYIEKWAINRRLSSLYYQLSYQGSCQSEAIY